MTGLVDKQPVAATDRTRSPVRILVVDDHPVVRQGLQLIISQHPDLEICGEAGGEDEAIRQFRALSPDFVVVDISLDSGNGLELTKELKAIRPDVKILVWSMHEESLYAERVVRAGARGYLNKTDAIDKVVFAIRTILDGKFFLSQEMIVRMLCRTVGVPVGEDREPLETLSDRELEVFEEIGHGVTTRQIAEKLCLSPKTVETYRENIKTKLNLANATELTRSAVQWVLENA